MNYVYPQGQPLPPPQGQSLGAHLYTKNVGISHCGTEVTTKTTVISFASIVLNPPHRRGQKHNSGLA
jgi:hypothetical protein